MLHVITPLRSLYAYINKKCLKKCAPKYKENIQRVSDKDRTKEGGGGKREKENNQTLSPLLSAQPINNSLLTETPPLFNA